VAGLADSGTAEHRLQGGSADPGPASTRLVATGKTGAEEDRHCTDGRPELAGLLYVVDLLIVAWCQREHR
jgi:hypothetical protein